MLDVWPHIVHQVLPSHQNYLQLLVLSAELCGVAHPRQCVVHSPPESPHTENCFPFVLYCFREGLLKIIRILLLHFLKFDSSTLIEFPHMVLNAVEIAHNSPYFGVVSEGGVVQLIGSSVCDDDVFASPETLLHPAWIENIIDDHNSLDFCILVSQETQVNQVGSVCGFDNFGLGLAEHPPAEELVSHCVGARIIYNNGQSEDRQQAELFIILP